MKILSEGLPGARTTPPASASLMVLLAVFGCCAPPTASADDKHSADVTITVIEDPEQLKEKIHKITLPSADADARAPRKSGKEDESGDDNRPRGVEAKSDADESRQQSAESHDNDASR